MNYRLSTTILSGLAVFFLIMWITKGCNPPTTPPEDTDLWREKVEMREAVIKTKDSIIASLQAIRATQREAYQKYSSRLVRENARLSRGYQKAKDEIAQLKDSLPVVNTFVQASDSLIAVKDSIIVVERNARMISEKLHHMEVGHMAEKNIQQQEINQEYAARVASLENKNARLEKRLRNPVSFGINAGPGVVYTPDGKFHGGLGANIGVSFKIRLR